MDVRGMVSFADLRQPEFLISKEEQNKVNISHAVNNYMLLLYIS